MPIRHARIALLLAASALCAVPALAQQPAGQPTSPPAAATQGSAIPATLAWPRSFDLGDQMIQLYQPMVEQFDGNQLTGRAAVAIGPKTGSPTYGIAYFTAHVTIDKPVRLVQLSNIAITKVDVPTDPSQDVTVMSALQSHLPPEGMTVALDHLLTSYAAGKEITKDMTQPVENTPPRVIFADKPTVLVLVAGEPVLRPVDGATGFQRVINTHPLILVDANGAFHLQAAGAWYIAKAIEGPWALDTRPDPSVQAAGSMANYAEAAETLLPANGQPPKVPPAVAVSTKPAELVITDGAPQMVPVNGTALLRVGNADHAIILDPTSNQYYILISGRWFRAAGLNGPWSFVPGSSLPADFKKIAPTDPAANALVAVPGTPQAKEAAIAATVPQTATISRNTQLTVQYDGGTPRFVPIKGTSLSYAENTRTPVIMVDPTRYYALFKGAWFVAGAPAGPWFVTATVPAAIYTIPASSPLHYVTYVKVYAATPDVVTVGYTPGYLGVVLGPDGTVVYGTGYDCVGYVGSFWYGCPATYGYNAAFAWTSGFAFGFAAGYPWGAWGPAWGPYWGPGPWGGPWAGVNVNQTNIYGQWGTNATITHAYGYNPWTGRDYAYNGMSGLGANGTAFQARSAAAFNPWTGNYAAGREGSFFNPNTGAAGAARAGVVGNVDSGNFAAGRQSAAYNPTTGFGHASESGVAVNNGQVSADSRGIAGNTKTGNAVAWNNGNIYTDHDGSIHQYDPSSGWQNHTAGGWQSDIDQSQIDRLNQQRSFQQFGNDRVDSIARAGGFEGAGGGFDRSYGGGDFGGFRGGGGDFGGGFRGGMGGFGGGFGGFRR